jgi:AraC family transcriptional activator of pobA
MTEHARRLTVDRLAPGAALEVVPLEDFRVGEGPLREPHRHDYHELLWVQAGSGEHSIDGEPVRVRPGTVTVIGRGQVHVFRHAEGLRGALLRFADEVLLGGGESAAMGWLLTARTERSIPVPDGEGDALDATLRALHAELARPPDAHSAGLQRHLVSTVLLWLERWHEGARGERRDADDPLLELQRRFTRRLEADFARHHDAAHYAEALGVPPAALAHALSRLTGRATKEHVTDRVMLEAARLLRFTDASVGEVAFRVGFRDQLYFSRAFRRRFGDPPVAYRERLRGG